MKLGWIFPDITLPPAIFFVQIWPLTSWGAPYEPWGIGQQAHIHSKHNTPVCCWTKEPQRFVFEGSL